MKEQMVTDALLREFLLGKVDDATRERLEGLFLTDSQVRERVLTAEQDLVEDYLEDNLDRADRERFLLQYAQTSEQRTKLKITKSIKDFALTHAAAGQPVPTSISTWDRLRAWLSPRFAVPIAAVIIIAVVIAVWVNRIEQRNRHLAIERELAQLNTPASLREVPPQMGSFELSPVTLRSAAAQNEVKTRPDIKIVELHLPWIRTDRYSTYDAVVRRVDDAKSFTIPNVQAEDNASMIRIRLRIDMIPRGFYRLELRGIAADGSRSEVEEYSFTVID